MRVKTKCVLWCTRKDELKSLKREAALLSGGTTVDTFVLFARRPQGKQAVAVVVVFFKHKLLGCVGVFL